jgi:hypothetical protein
LPSGWVRKKFCEPLSALFQAATHLPSTLSWLLCRLCLLIVFEVSCLSPLLQWRGLPAGYLYSLCLLKFNKDSSSLITPLLWWRGLPAIYFCRLCLLKVHMESGSVLFLPFLVCSKHPAPLCCMSFSVPCLLFSFWCFLQGRGQSVQGAIQVYPRSGCGSTTCCFFVHLLVCIAQAGLEPASGGAGALLVSQCNMVWRSFVRAGGVGCKSFAYSWWVFFLPNVAPASQQDY